MTISPFAAAVNGFFNGMGIRQGIEDRKRSQAREDERWDWEKEDRAWSKEERERLRAEGIEDRNWTKETRTRQRTLWGQQDQDRQTQQERETVAQGREDERWDWEKQDRAYNVDERASDDAWKREQRATTRVNTMRDRKREDTVWGREDEEYARDRAIKDAQARAFGITPQAPADTPAPVPGAPAAGAPSAGAAAVAPPQTTPEGTPELSVDTARETAADIGLKSGSAEKKIDQGSETIIRRYNGEQVSKIRDIYLGQGDIEKANAWEAFMKQESTKQAMGHWSRAVMAASMGDEAEFVNQIAAAYNVDGYYDDGYELIPEKSGFARDDEGKVIDGSAVLTFRNPKTGGEFTQNIEGQGDLYRFGISHLSAEQVFELGWSQYLAGRTAADDNRPKDNDLLKAMEQLGDPATAEGQAFRGLPLAEQRRRAMELLRGPAGGPAAGMGINPADIPLYGARE